MASTSELPGYLRLAKDEARLAPEDDLVRRHLWLAVRMANQVRPSGLDDDDRLGVANLALVEVARYWQRSPAKRRGAPFVPFASAAIKRAILEAARSAYALNVPRKIFSQIPTVTKTARRLAERLDRPPTDEEVAAALDWPLERVRTLRKLAAHPAALPLDAPVPGGDGEDDTFASRLADPDTDVEAEVVEKLSGAGEREALAQAVDALPPVMRATISLRAGIEVPSARTFTLDEVLRVADQLPSNTQKALRKLREEHARAIRPDAHVVGDDRGAAIEFGRAPSAPQGAARIDRAAHFWRGLAGDGQLPPALARIS